jgi:hypothetical protein
MYPILKPVDWKHFAPTELRTNSEPWFYKHFVPTGLFKKVTLSLITPWGKAMSIGICQLSSFCSFGTFR